MAPPCNFCDVVAFVAALSSALLDDFVLYLPYCLQTLRSTSGPKLQTDLFLHKIWGAAACPPQAFSIRPLPGFSLGAVSELFCQSRLSQSVCLCPKTSESLPGPQRISPAFLRSAISGPREASSWMSKCEGDCDDRIFLGFTVIGKTQFY